MFDDLAIAASTALVFGLLTLPVMLWVVCTDVTEMKIKNGAVLTMIAVFVLAGPLLLPLEAYGWRFFHIAVALASGFVLSLTTGMGAGDAKLIAAVAPFPAVADIDEIALIYVAWSALVLVGMALARRSSALRAARPHWIWFREERQRHIPFGLALAPTMTTYFLLGAIG